MYHPDKKILVVEDDAELRKNLARELLKFCSVLEAADGEEGVAKVLDARPNVVLLDLLLPKLDGFKVLERLRSYPDPVIAKIPVVVFSNLWSDKDILAAQALKIEKYFVKSETPVGEVIKQVEELLRTA